MCPKSRDRHDRRKENIYTEWVEADTINLQPKEEVWIQKGQEKSFRFLDRRKRKRRASDVS